MFGTDFQSRGNRWDWVNSQARAWLESMGFIVRRASSESLAVLELRVHIGNFPPRDAFVRHAFNVIDMLLETLAPNLISGGLERGAPFPGVASAARCIAGPTPFRRTTGPIDPFKYRI